MSATELFAKVFLGWCVDHAQISGVQVFGDKTFDTRKCLRVSGKQKKTVGLALACVTRYMSSDVNPTFCLCFPPAHRKESKFVFTNAPTKNIFGRSPWNSVHCLFIRFFFFTPE